MRWVIWGFYVTSVGSTGIYWILLYDRTNTEYIYFCWIICPSSTMVVPRFSPYDFGVWSPKHWSHPKIFSLCRIYFFVMDWNVVSLLSYSTVQSPTWIMEPWSMTRLYWFQESDFFFNGKYVLSGNRHVFAHDLDMEKRKLMSPDNFFNSYSLIQYIYIYIVSK